MSSAFTLANWVFLILYSMLFWSSNKLWKTTNVSKLRILTVAPRACTDVQALSARDYAIFEPIKGCLYEDLAQSKRDI